MNGIFMTDQNRAGNKLSLFNEIANYDYLASLMAIFLIKLHFLQ